MIADKKMKMLETLALQGSQRAADALGMFSGNALTVREAKVLVTTLYEIPVLYGNPELPIIGVNFAVSSDISGYLLASFTAMDAERLLIALLGEAPASIWDFGELELSAIGEAGNIIVSSFLSTLESLCGLDAQPSPPAVAVDMCGAILSSAVVAITGGTDSALVIEAEVTPVDANNTNAAACRVLFLPTPESWLVLEEGFVRQQAKREVEAQA